MPSVWQYHKYTRISATEMRKVLQEMETLSSSPPSGFIQLVIKSPKSGGDREKILRLLQQEAYTASCIKSRKARLAFTAAIQGMTRKFQEYEDIPDNGLVIFYGMEEEVEVGAEFEPPFLIIKAEYRAQGRFETKEAISDQVTGLPTLEDLGVKLVRCQDRMPFLLKGMFKDAYLDPVLGEWPDPEPPRPVAL